ncbi:MAG TPA: radical SAM protein [Acidobacteria bacterium]|nr:radical SAM protein [Acidobacteriota bacterium]
MTGAVRSWRPGYVRLARSGELERRVEALQAMLRDCTVCPRECHVDRFERLGTCATGPDPVVASSTAHFGEEPVISGRMGSGTIFLANCNLRCVFCQNHDISQRPRDFIGEAITAEELAAIHLALADRGCHNINWVSPTHQAPQLARALLLAAQRGLRLPIVYNTNAYDSVEVLHLLDGVVDVWMPDLKYADPEAGRLASRVADYPARARAAIAEMFRQVGDRWETAPDGTLRRGLLIRILVLPNDLAGVEDSLRWIASELSPRVAVSLMAQYYPTHLAALPGRYPLLSRPISAGEWDRALAALERFLDGERCYIQDFREAPAYYRPDFSDRDEPFPDAGDF